MLGRVGREPGREPAFEHGDRGVAFGQDVQLGQERVEVVRGRADGLGVQAGVRQRRGAVGEGSQDACHVGVAQPDEGVTGPVLGAQGIDQRDELGARLSGAVVEQRGEVVAQDAACALVVAAVLVLGAAPGAGEVVVDAGTGRADGIAIAQAGQKAFGVAGGAGSVVAGRALEAAAADEPFGPAHPSRRAGALAACALRHRGALVPGGGVRRRPCRARVRRRRPVRPGSGRRWE